MKISIVTASYNREETIKRAINSIKSQTYQNVECILVDGGSTDATFLIAKSLLGPSDCYLSEADSGVYDGLNKGISLASGEIIGFLHSDDLYEDRFVLQRVVDTFISTGADVVYGDASFFHKQEPKKMVRRYRSGTLSKQQLAWGRMPAHPSIFMKATLYRELHGFRENYKIAADYEFLCRLMTTKEVKSTYVPEVFVRMQTGGVSTSGLRSSVILNREVRRALLENKIKTNYLMILSKYPRKIMELYSK